MIIHQLRQGLMEGIRLFFWTFAFFYRHLSLVILSLIPTSFRVMQSWHQFDTPIWMEVVVEFSRVVLFFLIIAIMLNARIKQLFQKELWQTIKKQVQNYMRQSWPYITIGQILIFIICMYGLMNFLFEFLINKESVQIIMNAISIDNYDEKIAHDTIIFFIKNLSIIPMSLVYILRMLGIGKNQSQA